MLRTLVENLVEIGEEPVFAFYLDNQVDGELAFGGVNSAHCTEIVYMNLESTSYWQVNWDGLKLCKAAVEATLCAIIVSGTSFFFKKNKKTTHHGREVNCCFVEFVNCQLVQPRVHRRLQCHVQ